MTTFKDIILDSDDRDYALDHGLNHTLLTLYDRSLCTSDVIRVRGDHDFDFQNHWFRRSPLANNIYFQIPEPEAPLINVDLKEVCD